MIKSAADVAADIQKWIDGGSRPDEWKMREWVAVLAAPTEVEAIDLGDRTAACVNEFEKSFGYHISGRQTSIIRKHIEKALRSPLEAPVPSGWIEWKGGNMPLPAKTPVVIRFMDGSEHANDNAEDWIWGHSNQSDDIVAYRVRAPQKSE